MEVLIGDNEEEIAVADETEGGDNDDDETEG